MKGPLRKLSGLALADKRIGVDVDTFTYDQNSREVALYLDNPSRVFESLMLKHRTPFVTYTPRQRRFVVEVPITHRNSTTRIDGPGFTHDR